MLSRVLILTLLSVLWMEEACALLKIYNVLLKGVNYNYIGDDIDFSIIGEDSNRTLYVKISVKKDIPKYVKIVSLIEKAKSKTKFTRLSEYRSYFCMFDDSYWRTPYFLRELIFGLECIKQGTYGEFSNAGLFYFEDRIPKKINYFIKNTNTISIENTVLLKYELLLQHISNDVGTSNTLDILEIQPTIFESSDNIYPAEAEIINTDESYEEIPSEWPQPHAF